MELNEILQVALRAGASDIHLKAGLPPMFRVDGSLAPLKDARRLPPEEIARMGFGIMNEYQREKFKQTNEVDLAYGVPGLGRFRVNVFQQRGTVGVVLRVIPFKIQTIEQLMLPKVLEKIAGEQRGLILVTGTTGSGKSTTLAAMIDHINATETCHIMTIEDPIEFLIRDKRSIVNQREVGVDTMSFGQALKSALRQDPDVILVGEMRDLETIETALTAAETGHLVMSTLHTLDATETINRIISAFPPYQQKQVRLQLGSVLRGVISQRLVPRADSKGRVPAIEVLLCTTRVREMIEDKDRTKEIPEAISQGHTTYGMQTFDQSLMGLLKAGVVAYDEALRQATNPDDFALRVSGISGTSDSKWDSFEKPAKPVTAAPAARPAAPPAPRPPGSTPPQGVAVGRVQPTKAPVPRPAAPAAGPASSPGGGDDDFQIERF
jgi:twitching motility protein PilT